MLKASEQLTFVHNELDSIFLRTKTFPVNMRLYKSSAGYYDTVSKAIEHLENLVLEDYEDYSQPKGMSGANAAIPFNIVVTRTVDRASTGVFINPVIISGRGDYIAQSNCGSIRLPRKIKVKRFQEVEVRYFDVAGTYHCRWFSGPLALTLQHEIDHNNGILITDKEVK